MSLWGFTLPTLTEADPEISGEGSLDPLGLAQIADRLADHLVPGVRARMRRVRFVTAAAVGAISCEELFDMSPADGRSSPSICFEWLVLEAFARRDAQDHALDAAGVPGSSKTRAVIAHGHRLTANNYLKSPNVFGFTGVYLPLARSLHVLDDWRRPAANITELTAAWEQDQGLDGFTDAVPGTEGATFRRRLHDEVRSALHQSRCAAEPSSHLWGRLSRVFNPTGAGPLEKTVLTGWLCSDEEPIRAELARVLAGLPDVGEPELVQLLGAHRPSLGLQRRLAAVSAYERVSWLLDSAFRELRLISTKLGTAPMLPSSLADDPILRTVVAELPSAVGITCERFDQLDTGLLAMLLERLGNFEQHMSVPDFVDAMLTHHHLNQARKPPKGKRSWFEQLGAGWVVRPLYGLAESTDAEALGHVHPYRLASLQAFMRDLTL
jgi:hypothetical protein